MICRSHVSRRLFWVCFFCAACAPELDTTRRAAADVSAGTAIYEEICQRVSVATDRHDVDGRISRAVCQNGHMPPASMPRLGALHAQRTRFITAVDEIVPPSLTQDFKSYLAQLLPLYDNGLMAQQAAALAQLIEALQMSPAAVTALAHITQGQGENGLAGESFVHAVLQSPHLEAWLTNVLAVLGAPEGQAAWQQMQAALHSQLQRDPSALFWGDATGFMAVRDLLLQENRLATGLVAPRWVVLRDDHGMAQRALAGAQAEAPPFGAPNTEDRDAWGRWVNAVGEPMYNYRDVASSHLAGLMAQLRGLWQHDAAALLSLPGALRATLGPPHVGTDAPCAGDAAAASPWADMAALAGWLVQQDGIEELAQVAQMMWANHEAELGALLHLGSQAATWAEAPAVQKVTLQPNNTLVDDLLTIGGKIAAEPGLLADIIEALQDPNTAHLGPLMAAHMRHRDRIDMDPEHINGPPLGAFETPVDRSAPDTQSNMSVMQRLLHLVHDARQVSCNRRYYTGQVYDACELFKIDDAGEFYLRAIVGKAQMTMRFFADDEGAGALWETLKIGAPPSDDLPPGIPVAAAEMSRSDVPETPIGEPADDDGSGLEDDGTEFSGLEGMTQLNGFRPVAPNPAVCNPPGESRRRVCAAFSATPQAAARMVFARYMPYHGRTFLREISEEFTTDGKSFNDLHQGTLFAWELDGFFAAARPLLQAFAAHDREGLALDILETLHRHWPTARNDTTQPNDVTRMDYAAQTGLSQMEDYFATLFDSGAALAVLGDVARAAATVNVQGRTGAQLFAVLLEKMFEPQTDAQFVQLFPQHLRHTHGGPALAPPAAAHVLHGVFKTVQAQMGERTYAPPTSLRRAAGHVFFKVNPAHRLENRQAYALAGDMLRFIAARAANIPDPAVQNLGAVWRNHTLALLGHPLTVALLRLSAAIDVAPDQHAALKNLGDDLMAHHFDSGVDASAAILQAGHNVGDGVPLLRSLAGAFAPHTGLAAVGTPVLLQSRAADTRRVVPQLLPNLLRKNARTGETPLAALADIYAQVNRLQPGHEGPLSAEDWHSAAGEGLLPTLHRLVIDKAHGLRRLLDVVRQRHGMAPGSAALSARKEAL